MLLFAELRSGELIELGNAHSESLEAALAQALPFRFHRVGMLLTARWPCG